MAKLSLLYGRPTYLHSFKQFEDKSKLSCEILHKIDGLPTGRVTIRPHFPGHVLIFKSYITVRAEFSKSTQMSGNCT